MSAALSPDSVVSSSVASHTDMRDREEVLAAARKKLKNYRKGKRSSMASKRGSISSLNSSASISSMLSSSVVSSSTGAGSGESPIVVRPSPTQHMRRHSRRQSSLGGGSASSLKAMLARSGGAGSTPASSPSPSPSSAASMAKAKHAHRRSVGISPSSSLGPNTSAGEEQQQPPYHYHTGGLPVSPSPKGSAFPPSPSSASSPAFGGGHLSFTRQQRPLSVSLQPYPQLQQPPPHQHQPKQPSVSNTGGGKRHSHRRSLSVSTRRESLDVMLLPGAAARIQAREEEEIAAAAAAGGGRRSALDALEGRKSVVNQPPPEPERVVLPDLSDDDGVLMPEAVEEPFSFPQSIPTPTMTSRSGGLTKRDSFGKLLPASVLLSLSSAPSSGSSSPVTPSSSSSPSGGMMSPGGTFSSGHAPSPPSTSSPRMVEGFSSGLGLGGIVEEEEEEEEGSEDVPKTARLPPSRLAGRPASVRSPMLYQHQQQQLQNQQAQQTREQQLRHQEQQQLPMSASPTATSRFEDEQRRFQAFSFARPRSLVGAPAPAPKPSPPPPPPPAARLPTDEGARMKAFSFGRKVDDAPSLPAPGDRMKTFAFGAAPSRSASSGAGKDRMQTFAFPNAAHKPSSLAAPPLAEEDSSSSDQDVTPNPNSSGAFASPTHLPIPPTASPPPQTTALSPPKRALRPLTLASPSPSSSGVLASPGPETTSPSRGSFGISSSASRPITPNLPSTPGTARGLRPLSLSLAGNTTSPSGSSLLNSSVGSSANGSPPEIGTASNDRYGTIGRGRPAPSPTLGQTATSPARGGARWSVSSAGSFSSGGGISGVSISKRSSIGLSPSQGKLNGEKRRSSISYHHTRANSGGGSSGSMSLSSTSSFGGGVSRSLSSSSTHAKWAAPVTRGPGNGASKCPTRPLSLSLGVPESGMRRWVLTDVGERADEEGKEEEEEEVVSQFSEEENEEEQEEKEVPLAVDEKEQEKELTLSQLDQPRPSASIVGDDDEERDQSTSLKSDLAARLEHVEAERDALAEDVDGWRTRCQGLEARLAEEKRIGGIERDLARERIKKLGDRLASLDSAQLAAAAGPAAPTPAVTNAQTALVSDLRDQLFALASSLARSEEGRKAAEDVLHEERDLVERRIAEAVDADRRATAAAVRRARELQQQMEQQQRQQQAVTAVAGTPLTPPLSNCNSSSQSSIATSAGGSVSRFSFGAATPSSRNPPEEIVYEVDEEQEHGGTVDFGYNSAWARTNQNGEIDLANFGVVPTTPRALESLVEEEEIEEEDADKENAVAHRSSIYDSEDGSYRASFEESDDNIALGLDEENGPLDGDDSYGYDGAAFRSRDDDDDDDEEGQYAYERHLRSPSEQLALTPRMPTPPPVTPTVTIMAPSPVGNQDVHTVEQHLVLSPNGPPSPDPRRASLVKAWKFPQAPAAPPPPRNDLAALLGIIDLTTETAEDLQPWAAWVVPVSPNPASSQNSPDPATGGARFPSAIASSAASSFQQAAPPRGYNDPPSSIFGQGPSASSRDVNQSSASGGARRYPPLIDSAAAAGLQHQQRPSSSASNYSTGSSTPRGVSAAQPYRSAPPPSRSAQYQKHNPLASSTSSSVSLTPSRFSFTSLTSAIGSYVLPPSSSSSSSGSVRGSGGGLSSVAAGLCSVDHQPHHPAASVAGADESGQWVLRAHQPGESLSLEPAPIWLTPPGLGPGGASLPPITATAMSSSATRPAVFIDASMQPTPHASPLNQLDFRGTCSSCYGDVMEL